MVCTKSSCPYLRENLATTPEFEETFRITNREEVHHALRNLHLTAQSLIIALDSAQRTNQQRQNQPMMQTATSEFMPYGSGQQDPNLGYSMYSTRPISPHANMAPQSPMHQGFIPTQYMAQAGPTSSSSQIPFDPYANQEYMMPTTTGDYGGDMYALKPCSCTRLISPTQMPSTLPRVNLSGPASMYLPMVVSMNVVESKSGVTKLIPYSVEVLKDKLPEEQRKTSARNVETKRNEAMNEKEKNRKEMDEDDDWD